MDTSNTRKRIIVDWHEEDYYTIWRKWYCYTKRSGVGKWIKRRTHKRERHEAIVHINEFLEE